MSYKYYNAHPKGIKTTDCVVRAISTALNKDYMECRRELNRFKKQHGFESYKEREFIYAFLKKYQKISFPAVKGTPRIKGADFSQTYKKGAYILNMAGHLTVCVDGVVYDIWDCTHKMVYNCWKIR